MLSDHLMASFLRNIFFKKLLQFDNPSSSYSWKCSGCFCDTM